ncbi:hypothetical protein PQX77_000119 [Marasmius sp. AFHP31]|nr:hypothetical protein PQX77_000119 [Marasmius sp. AFHP31]
MKTLASLCLLFLWFSLVGSIPLWESVTGQISIDSLVPFASYVEAKTAFRDGVARYLTFPTPERSGNLTISEDSNSGSPPLFYVRNNQLFHFINETYIVNVNVVNTTTIAPPTAEFPLQLAVDKKRKGIRNGSWVWRGTMLHYEFGGRSNGGVYYSCPAEDGGSKLLTFLRG